MQMFVEKTIRLIFQTRSDFGKYEVGLYLNDVRFCSSYVRLCSNNVRYGFYDVRQCFSAPLLPGGVAAAFVVRNGAQFFAGQLWRVCCLTSLRFLGRESSWRWFVSTGDR